LSRGDSLAAWAASCGWRLEIAILWHDQARKKGAEEVAEGGFRAGLERAERAAGGGERGKRGSKPESQKILPRDAQS